jgi:hypothetical protein
MADRDRQASSEHNPNLAPELVNDEQEEESSQAQTVTDQAMVRNTSVLGLDDTEKVTTGDISDDSQDLIDHMRQMETSGRVDMDAYAGEPDHDDDQDMKRKQANAGSGTDPDEARADEL